MAIASFRSRSRLCLLSGASSESIEISREDLARKISDQTTNGLRGDRAVNNANRCVAVETVSGSIHLQPSRRDFDLLLPRVLGGAESNDLFLPANILPTFGVLVDRGAAVYQYDDCVIDRAILRGRSGKPVELELAIRAVRESLADTFPDLPTTAVLDSMPFSFPQAVLALDGDEWEMFEFTLLIENQLTARFVNSATATGFVPGVRRISLQATLPLHDETAERFANQQVEGVAGSLALQSGAHQTTFSMPALAGRGLSPMDNQQGEKTLSIELIAAANEAAELVVFNGSSL